MHLFLLFLILVGNIVALVFFFFLISAAARLSVKVTIFRLGEYPAILSTLLLVGLAA